MNKLAVIFLFVMTGCSSFSELPNSQLLVDKEIRGLSRNEVIMAINECESNRTRAVVIMAKQKISGRTTDVVTDVTCAPKYTY